MEEWTGGAQNDPESPGRGSRTAAGRRGSGSKRMENRAARINKEPAQTLSLRTMSRGAGRSRDAQRTAPLPGAAEPPALTLNSLYSGFSLLFLRFRPPLRLGPVR